MNVGLLGTNAFWDLLQIPHTLPVLHFQYIVCLGFEALGF